MWPTGKNVAELLQPITKLSMRHSSLPSADENAWFIPRTSLDTQLGTAFQQTSGQRPALQFSRRDLKLFDLVHFLTFITGLLLFLYLIFPHVLLAGWSAAAVGFFVRYYC